MEVKKLSDAKVRFFNDLHFNNKATCPCCERRAQRYTRKLNKGMVSVLIKIYKKTDGERAWIHVRDIFGGPAQVHRDWPLLAHWKLIEKKPPGRTAETNASGHWRITSLGRSFVQGKVKVPSHALVYEGKFVEYVGEKIGIREAAPFEYAELMGKKR